MTTPRAHSPSTCAALVAVLLVVLVGVVSPAGATTGDRVRADEMTQQQAGRYYLKVTCPKDEVRVRFNRIVFGPDDGVTLAEARRRLPEFKRVSGEFGRANYRWARGLVNPPAPWPSNVAGPVDTAATKILGVSRALAAASRASTAVEWARHVAKAAKLNRATPADTIRARLDLPPPGRGC
jgi:hypothetical protein